MSIDYRIYLDEYTDLSAAIRHAVTDYHDNNRSDGVGGIYGVGKLFSLGNLYGAADDSFWNEIDELAVSGSLSFLEYQVDQGFEFRFSDNSSSWLDSGKGQGVNATDFLNLFKQNEHTKVETLLLSGDNYIYDNLGDEAIYAGAGDDQIFWVAGNDTVFGGTGNDTLKLKGSFTASDFEVINYNNEQSFSLVNNNSGEVIDVFGVEELHFISFDWVNDPYIGSSILLTLARTWEEKTSLWNSF